MEFKKAPLTLATDGSCLKNPGGPSGWAWVAEDGRCAMGGKPVGTNNEAELMGLITALRDNPTGPLIVQMDSELVVKTFTSYVTGWEKNGWKTRSGEPVKNLALIKMVMRLLAGRDKEDTVRFVKVPGHDAQGRWPMNTVADSLAQNAAKTASRENEPFEESGERKPFGQVAPGAVNVAGETGRAPGQKCDSCGARIRDTPPYCRCDLT